MLHGEVDCEIIARIICNVNFKETNKILFAKSDCPDIEIPTLTINNKQDFDSILSKYVVTMLDFYQDFQFASIDTSNYIPYIIATAIANMGKQDYLNPEIYFQKRIMAIKDNPFILSTELVPLGHNENFNCELSYIVNKEKPNEECPFSYTLVASNGEETFEFQTIRFYINDDTAYIGAIQGKKPTDKNQFQKKVQRIIYKANEGITEDNQLYATNPGSVITLTSFIALLNSYGINKITILPYGIQRLNDKKLLYHNLNNKLTNLENDNPIKLKVINVIERTSSYFDKQPIIRKQLILSLLRFNYHLSGNLLTEENEIPMISCNQIKNGNNNLLNNIYGQCYQSEHKKTNQNG